MQVTEGKSVTAVWCIRSDYPPLLESLGGIVMRIPSGNSIVLIDAFLLDLCARHVHNKHHVRSEGDSLVYFILGRLGERSMIDFVVESSNVRTYILDNRSEMSTDGRVGCRMDLVNPNVWMNWDRLAEGSVREVFNSHLQKSFLSIPGEVRDTEGFC